MSFPESQAGLRAPVLAWATLLLACLTGACEAGGGEATADIEGSAATTADAVEERGIRHAEQGAHERALAAFDSALALEPGRVSALSNRGVARFQLARWDDALADFDRVVQLLPDEAKSWYDRAYVLDQKGELARAEADLTRAIELDSAFADAWLNRGIVRARAGDLDRALADFDRAVELEPGVAMYKDRGIARFEAGHYQDAVADFSELIRREPQQARHYLRRGRAYRALGDRSLAEADFRHLLMLTGNPEIRKQAIEELRVIGALPPRP